MRSSPGASTICFGGVCQPSRGGVSVVVRSQGIEAETTDGATPQLSFLGWTRGYGPIVHDSGSRHNTRPHTQLEPLTKPDMQRSDKVQLVPIEAIVCLVILTLHDSE